jgi:predicted enzyme related to lactoylglutathione lyase
VEVGDFTLNLTSQDPEKLAAFYQEVVGLPRDETIGGHSFRVGAARLRISGHSETSGQAKEPTRCLINLFVDGVDSEFQRLSGLGVTVVRSPTREKWGGLVSTFADPDGNYFQLIEPHSKGLM